jgi:Na+/H+ antiporter NhaD/arsenite permease-like protein
MAHAAGPAADAAPALAWGIPFAGTILSIGLLPVLVPRLWHRHMAVVAAFWILALLVPQAVLAGPAFAAHAAWHAVLLDYLPFVSLLLAMFTLGGGILVEGGPWGTPGGNTLLLAIGTMISGVIGPIGTSMVLIHPLLRANAHRRRKVHLVVFFIALVSNAGGAVTPLGNPPLYIGLLRGVPYAWPLLHLALPLALLAAALLLVFWLIDRHAAAGSPPPEPRGPLRLRGRVNLALLLLVVGAVLAQSVWRPGATALFGVSIGIERLAGIGVFLAVSLLSMAITPAPLRTANMFSWAPMAEVAKLFAAIFITITPVLAMLAATTNGPLAPLLKFSADAQGHPSPLAYFWLTGTFSAFLDNAPTYLVFFDLAGGDPVRLTGALSRTLQAISLGSVVFGALTYIGNAPNMMVRSVAAHRGLRMPGFFGYMAWSCALLLPMFVALTLLFFR